MNQLAEDLRAARALIERGWTRRVYARDRAGREVEIDSPGACRFCPLGAIARLTRPSAIATTGRIDPEADARALAMEQALSRASGDDPFNVVVFNDRLRRKKSEVLALFDRAIALAGQAPC